MQSQSATWRSADKAVLGSSFPSTSSTLAKEKY
jgi:hypothetical protein